MVVLGATAGGAGRVSCGAAPRCELIGRVVSLTSDKRVEASRRVNDVSMVPALNGGSLDSGGGG